MTYSVLDAPCPAEEQAPLQRSFRRHDGIAAGVCMLLGFLTVRYLLFLPDGFATTALFLLMFFCAVWYHRKCGFAYMASHRLQGGVICLFSLSFSLTDNGLLHTLAAFYLIAALTWLHYSAAHGLQCTPRFLFFHLNSLLLNYSVDELGTGYKAIGQSCRSSKTGNAVRIILLGLLLSLPLTLMVAALLSSADAGVAKILNTVCKLFSEEFFSIAGQMLLAPLVGAWIFAVLYAATNTRRYPRVCDQAFEQRMNGLRFLPTLGLCTAVTPICLLYVIYVVSQISYFCSAFWGDLPENMIYSQYARRGFFELCAIAVLNLLVLLVINGCCKRNGEHKPMAASIYSCALCLFTLFIIATALAKMIMYINAYGLTRPRLYTAWFMVLLAVVFVILLIMQFRKLPAASVLTAVFTLWLGILCFARPDALIAEYNITRWEKGSLKTPDWYMLCELSDDAYAVICKHWDSIYESDKEMIQRKYDDRLREYDQDIHNTWNLSTQYLLHCREDNYHE